MTAITERNQQFSYMAHLEEVRLEAIWPVPASEEESRSMKVF